MKQFHSGLLALTFAVLVVSRASAQEAATTSVGTNGGQTRAVKLRSPVVLPDHRVIFQLLAPKALDVLLVGNWASGRDVPMN
jgi:hypothetical protein